MNEDQNRAVALLLAELWQGDTRDIPRPAAYDPPVLCAGCGRELRPDVLRQQPMANYCHWCCGAE
ncbi:hypothetical protein [Escherichia coli]|uniref:hypothetical protein n=1 Tax=Escherichia coli TaxID=562 RepID=UPI000BDE9F85|nr:hypothetical protein [Escherichia coli]